MAEIGLDFTFLFVTTVPVSATPDTLGVVGEANAANASERSIDVRAPMRRPTQAAAAAAPALAPGKDTTPVGKAPDGGLTATGMSGGIATSEGGRLARLRFEVDVELVEDARRRGLEAFGVGSLVFVPDCEEELDDKCGDGPGEVGPESGVGGRPD